MAPKYTINLELRFVRLLYPIQIYYRIAYSFLCCRCCKVKFHTTFTNGAAQFNVFFTIAKVKFPFHFQIFEINVCRFVFPRFFQPSMKTIFNLKCEGLQSLKLLSMIARNK